MQRVRASIFVSILSAALLSACQWVLGIDNIDGETRADASAVDAQGDAGSDATTIPFTCAFPPPGVPAPPSFAFPDDDSGVHDYIVFAFQTMKSADAPGVNLDCRDTESGDAGVVDKPCATSPVDQDGGVDNELLGALQSVIPVTTDFLNEVYGALTLGGAQSLILVVQRTGSDGVLPEAGTLTSPAYMTSSTAGLAAVGCPSTFVRGFCPDGGDTCDAGSQDAGARWDGCDTWSSLTDPALGSSVTTTNLGLASQTYVQDGKLVIRFDALTVALNGGGLNMEDVTIIAQPSTVVVDGGASITVLDGQIVGRIPAEDLLRVAARYVVSGMKPVCTTGLLNDSTKAKLCVLRDLPTFDPAHPEQRGGNAAATCTRLSVALEFHAVQANILPSNVSVPYVDPCEGGFDASCLP